MENFFAGVAVAFVPAFMILLIDRWLERQTELRRKNVERHNNEMNGLFVIKKWAADICIKASLNLDHLELLAKKDMFTSTSKGMASNLFLNLPTAIKAEDFNTVEISNHEIQATLLGARSDLLVTNEATKSFLNLYNRVVGACFSENQRLVGGSVFRASMNNNIKTTAQYLEKENEKLLKEFAKLIVEIDEYEKLASGMMPKRVFWWDSLKKVMDDKRKIKLDSQKIEKGQEAFLKGLKGQLNEEQSKTSGRVMPSF